EIRRPRRDRRLLLHAEKEHRVALVDRVPRPHPVEPRTQDPFASCPSVERREAAVEVLVTDKPPMILSAMGSLVAEVQLHRFDLIGREHRRREHSSLLSLLQRDLMAIELGEAKAERELACESRLERRDREE